MKILFLDQSGKLGGAELCLADIAEPFQTTSLVAVFTEGSFPAYLRKRHIQVKILADQSLQVQKASGLLAGVKSINRLVPLITKVAQLSKQYDLLYANTQKALVVGAIASFISRRPMVYHLHDIVSSDHFSATNRRIIINLANRAALIIANSEASRDAFIQAGGRSDCIHVVYNHRPLDFSILQALAPQKVEREPYDGPVIDLITKVEEAKVTEVSPKKSAEDPFLHRPPTRGGGRNMQESSFAFSG